MNELKHVAFICDGNGRWAKNLGKERTYGHNIGSDVVKDIAIHMKRKYSLECVSFYIFSTENWKRPKHEVMFIVKMLNIKLKKWVQLFLDEDVALKFIGSKNGLSKDLIDLMEKYENLTKHCKTMTINLCFNYGSRLEITEAVQSIVNDNVLVENIDEQLISNYLYTKGQAEVDLLIRTSGEQRISNFYLWQLAYSELSFVDCFWPEVTPEIIDVVINEYNNRSRRFGDIK